ncbi:hypothetical protein HOP52_16185 [Halomonas campisalis]|uniref:Uncharacterized protein n=1 Tax=Billgrantia campisalis TaxID=74661 RepID=A0ABS9PC10_9GAMM|nr:phage protease [Halomonas campisalis]MCG6659298.1 hypothetical protein [Halomonas campisalis]MDR5864297.1 phage protease [Halomonas campisalis]
MDNHKRIATGMAAFPLQTGQQRGRLSDAELAVCREMGLSPEEFCQANPVEPTQADRSLNDVELAVCKAMGLSSEAYRQANPEDDSPQEIEALIAEGLRDGRIAGPATATWLRQQGVAACRSHLTRVPGTEALKHGISDAELAVCRRMGLSPAAYRRANSNNE